MHVGHEYVNHVTVFRFHVASHMLGAVLHKILRRDGKAEMLHMSGATLHKYSEETERLRCCPERCRQTLADHLQVVFICLGFMCRVSFKTAVEAHLLVHQALLPRCWFGKEKVAKEHDMTRSACSYHFLEWQQWSTQ